MSGWVYGFRSFDFVKIGIASHIGERLRQMRLFNPHPIKIVLRRHCFDPYFVERRMHDMLWNYSIGREWFRVSDKLIREAFEEVRIEADKRQAEHEAWEAQFSPAQLRAMEPKKVVWTEGGFVVK